jgi:hypothetical protein
VTNKNRPTNVGALCGSITGSRVPSALLRPPRMWGFSASSRNVGAWRWAQRVDATL